MTGPHKHNIKKFLMKNMKTYMMEFMTSQSLQEMLKDIGG